MKTKSYTLILAAGLIAVPSYAAQTSSANGQNQPQTPTERQDQTQTPTQSQYQNRTPANTNAQSQMYQGQSTAQNTDSSGGSSDTANQGTRVRGHREAARMVRVRAVFTHDIDSQKDHPGATCDLKLTHDADLHNGVKLPSGTMLIGRVVNDDTQPGNARLALRFSQARLKDGQTIPVKATIVGVYNTPDANSDPGYGRDPGTIPPSWNDGTLQVDQIDALPGIDLHSKIASANSGVFVSTKKDDIKLSPEYELVLAVAAQNHGSANSAGNSYGSTSPR